MSNVKENKLKIALSREDEIIKITAVTIVLPEATNIMASVNINSL